MTGLFAHTYTALFSYELCEEESNQAYLYIYKKLQQQGSEAGKHGTCRDTSTLKFYYPSLPIRLHLLMENVLRSCQHY